jgi:hypothetical protein
MSHKLTEEEKEKQRRADLDRYGRWRSGKRRWARSTPSCQHLSKTTLFCYEILAVRKKLKRWKLVRKRSGEDSDRVWVKNY